MARKLWLLTLLALLAGGTAFGEQPAKLRQADPEPSLIDITPTPTPEMWFYLHQLRRYDDPQHAIRRRAEALAEERHQRIAAAKWYGVSNLRPTVLALPYMSVHQTPGEPYPRFGTPALRSFRVESSQPLAKALPAGQEKKQVAEPTKKSEPTQKVAGQKPSIPAVPATSPRSAPAPKPTVNSVSSVRR